ncbi:recombinase family protein [Mesorhizobium sp. M0217]|uniref:recombinase family protein n=1 Tax=unclassified Mesorhizobium TaxID=325217 RepID=UPI00333CACCF
MKVALGARYSTDNHRDASIEDQLRLCCLRAEKQGWTVVDSNTHRAMCGASLLLPCLQELISDAMQGKFLIVLAEGDGSPDHDRCKPGAGQAGQTLQQILQGNS